MTRRMTILCAGTALAFLGVFVLAFFRFPSPARQTWLSERLEESRVVPIESDTAKIDVGRLQKAIAAKPNLWNELVAAPAPIAAAPDLQKMLEGVAATRQQIGDKVKLTSKAKPRGDYVSVGDTYNGLIVKSITVKDVIFALIQANQEYTLSLPRQ